METIYAALFAWALTAYYGNPVPSEGYPPMPYIIKKTHGFFVENACGGNEKCRVVGWYSTGRFVYYERNMNPESDLMARSIVVHEMIHYLQEMSNPQPGEIYPCTEIIKRERQAYAIQQRYIAAHGAYYPTGIIVNTIHCGADSQLTVKR